MHLTREENEMLEGKHFLILDPKNAKQWKKVFTTKRMAIVSELRKKNPKTETQLAKALKRKRENIIYDLNILEYYNIILREKSGRKKNIKLNRSLAIIPFC